MILRNFAGPREAKPIGDTHLDRLHNEICRDGPNESDLPYHGIKICSRSSFKVDKPC
jgi:hypothetical protein